MAPKSKKTTTRKTAAPRGTSRVRAAATPTPTTAGRARTVIYVHGIGNKPPADVLKCQWDHALFGFDLGERTRLAYWVDRTRYPQPSPGTCHNADTTQLPAESEASGRIRSTAEAGSMIPPGVSPKERAVLERLASETLAAGASGVGEARAARIGVRVLPFPQSWREFFTRALTRLWLRDVNDFLFDEARRDAMCDSVRQRLDAGGGPFVVIGHSQGSMVAYEALRSLPANHPAKVDLFITIGSPLGLTEVQDQLKKLAGIRGKLATPECVSRWVNVADPIDPVCADKTLGDDYLPNRRGVRAEDSLKPNPDSPKDPHSGSGYLRLEVVREAVRRAVSRDLFQRVAPFRVARDVVKQLERGLVEERHPVLIELLEDTPAGQPVRSLKQVGESVCTWIKKEAKNASADELEIEHLTHYVAANLTRFEVEKLADELHTTAIYRVFRNSRKRALLTESASVVHAPTAHRGYKACGRGITVAVLDTGIDPDHPHFAQHNNVAGVFDCLAAGPVQTRDPKDKKKAQLGVDVHGHGTHVSGIIAGAQTGPEISGIAPEAKIVSYKVLDDSGGGSDAKIIKAMDHIFATNAAAPQLIIHCVNLSLGGSFDPEVFGCGDSPLCKQLRKLWRQGVVVVIAAGNEGFLELQQGADAVGLNVDLSIGDPANLDECLAVGSVHKSKPHLYGVSYFSSRGPTADGRPKPDLVAPGEKILSCRAGGRPGTNPLGDQYLAMSGTSMAAPHVAGVVACFLSSRREFIGYPDRIKKHMLANCTDLERDRMHQGAGVPNLVKMLLNT